MPSTNQANKQSLSCSLLSCLSELKYSPCLLMKSIFPLQKILQSNHLRYSCTGQMGRRYNVPGDSSSLGTNSKVLELFTQSVFSIKTLHSSVIGYVWDLQLYPQKRKLYFHVEQEEQVIWVRILKSATTFNLKVFAYKIIPWRHF